MARARARRTRSSSRGRGLTFDAIFSRTARFYATVLGAGSEAQWAELMASSAVEISIDEDFVGRPGGQRLLLVLVNILARCFGHVRLRDSSALAGPLLVEPVIVTRGASLAATVETMIVAIRGVSAVDPDPVRVIRVHVGPRPPRPWIPAVTGGGWRAQVWPAQGAPRSWNGDPNALAAIAGAILMSVEATRAFIESVSRTPNQCTDRPVILDPGTRTRYALPLGRMEVSVADLVDPSGEEPGDVGSVDLGALGLVSVGAVNGDLLYFIRCLDGPVRADIEAVEPQLLGPTDLNRYLYTVAAQVGRPKMASAEALRTATLTINVERARLEDTAVDWSNRVVVSGVDNNAGRWALQERTPGWIISLESEHQEGRVSIHRRGSGACLRCVHTQPIEPDPEQPTHPAVSAWPGLLALVLLQRGRKSWTPGLQVRINGLAPWEWGCEILEALEACPTCMSRDELLAMRS